MEMKAQAMAQMTLPMSSRVIIPKNLELWSKIFKKMMMILIIHDKK
jgi:hypothetical protein